MPTVSELRERASSYEQEGQIAKALAVYDHVLKHLAGKPAIAKVVSLFVKVGDLRLRLDHRADAVAAYENAAEHYAAQGSSQRVTAMCTKILGAQPGRLGVHAKFARQLVGHGHVGAATDVLVEYAQDAQLDKAVEVLDELEGRPDAVVKPMLESLLDSIERGEPLKTEETARRVSRRLSIETDAIVGELSNVLIETSSGEDVAAVVANAADRTSEPLTPEALDLGFTTGELATVQETPPEDHEAPAADTEPVAAEVSGPEPPVITTPHSKPSIPDLELTADVSAAIREWKPPVTEPPTAPAVDGEKAPPSVTSTPEHLEETSDLSAAAREWRPPVTDPPIPPAVDGEKSPPSVTSKPTPKHLEETSDLSAAAREWKPSPTEPEPGPQKTRRSPALLVVGGFLVGLLSGVGLAMAGVIPIVSGNGSEAPIAPTPPPVQQPDAPTPAPVTPVADTTAAVGSVADTPSAADTAIDTTLASYTAVVTDSVAGLSTTDSLATPVDTTPSPTPTDTVSVDPAASTVPIMVAVRR